MKYKIGDLVTRNSYHNDTVFIITDIDNDMCFLKGKNIRLCADSLLSDLEMYEESDNRDELDYMNKVVFKTDLNRDDYFYLPGKILHIDGDTEYLNRCLKYYSDMNIWAMGLNIVEDDISDQIYALLKEYNPNIVVITGHDAYYKKKGNVDDISAYKNSSNFVEAVREARRFEKSHDKLIIIAGACQSDYEELIKAGANFASSPKRINIHALDPAVIAAKMSLSEVSSDIDLKMILDTTKYGTSGIGGVKTKGTMYVGFPR